MSLEGAQPHSFKAAVLVWLKIGLLSFGGPAAQIALMHREMVQRRQYLSEQQYLSGLSFCMLLPGPEAMQLATYGGWRLFGIRGGLIAGSLFVIPGALVILLLAIVYTRFGEVPMVSAVFTGVKAAVLVIIVEALIRLYRRMAVSTEAIVISVVAFISIFFFQLSFPLIVLGFALYGYVRASGNANGSSSAVPVDYRSTLITLFAGITIWWLPVGVLWIAEQELLTEVAIFFSKLAVVTFGGAYAVLAYMAQDVVVQHQWLSHGEMIDALGLAETTPGPLILVTEFVAFISGYHQGGITLAVAAAMVALWVTFIPCFLWIFLGAPFIEMISTHGRLKSAMEAVTAAVLGVMVNLSLWFALHVLFERVTPVIHGLITLWTPELLSFNIPVVLMTLLAAYLLLLRHWHVVAVLAVMSIVGLINGTYFS